MTREEQQRHIRDFLDSYTPEETACICMALLTGNGGTLDADELTRQYEVIRSTLADARLQLAIWELVRAGELSYAVSPAGEVAVVNKPAVSVAALEERARRSV